MENGILNINIVYIYLPMHILTLYYDSLSSYIATVTHMTVVYSAFPKNNRSINNKITVNRD